MKETKRILASIVHTAFRINEMTHHSEIAIHYILGAEDIYFFSDSISSDEFKEIREFLQSAIQKIIKDEGGVSE